MNIIDIAFWGWYKILDKTVYLYRTEQGGIGPREHAFFIAFLLHGINVWSLFRYLSIEYFGTRIEWGILIGLTVFVIGYFVYFRNRRWDKIASLDIGRFQAFLYIALTLAYTIVSVYIMLELGNYIRYKLHGE